MSKIPRGFRESGKTLCMQWATYALFLHTTNLFHNAPRTFSETKTQNKQKPHGGGQSAVAWENNCGCIYFELLFGISHRTGGCSFTSVSWSVMTGCSVAAVAGCGVTRLCSSHTTHQTDRHSHQVTVLHILHCAVHLVFHEQPAPLTASPVQQMSAAGFLSRILMHTTTTFLESAQLKIKLVKL